MADDDFVSRARASGFAAPPGHGVRRAFTIDASAASRPRPTSHQAPDLDAPPRRSSNFSDYSISEARRTFQSGTGGILNPGARASRDSLDDEDDDGHHGDDASSLSARLPLVFALMPAVGGILFQNGSAVVSDAILLVLAAVFLHWSVTLPWYVSPY